LTLKYQENMSITSAPHARELWAVLQHDGAALDEHSGELLAALLELAQRLPEPPEVRVALLVAPGTPFPDLEPLRGLPIAHIDVLAHPALEYYSTISYTDALAWLIRERRPLLVATGATANGRDWMPRLAARMDLPFAPGCLDIDLRDDVLFSLRSIYAGRAFVQTRTLSHGRTALATLLPGVRGNPVPASSSDDTHQQMDIRTLAPLIEGTSEESRIKRLSLQAPSPEEVELEAADRIVAGGRGMGREGFAYVASFAKLLGAAVGATRVATDRGWVEHTRQIGATGKSVHPRLYIACGISGAAQHTSGMREAQTVIVINPDRSAPIFALADLGLLGDANQVLPLAAELIDKRTG
jgi:electron transfer flavoprotein alpha subunit